MKIFVSMGDCEAKDSFFTSKVKEELAKLGDVTYNPSNRQERAKEELIQYLPGMDVLISGWQTAAVDADVLKAADRLKIHAHVGGTVANNTTPEEYEKGITVLSGNDLFAKSVAEGCLAYTLMAERHLYDEVTCMRENGWRRSPCTNSGLIGKKIGIVGYGAISRYYIDLLKWFHPEILVVSSHLSKEEANKLGIRIASAEEVFSECDIISLHSALNSSSRGCITKKLLRLIRPGALLVNTARAGMINEEDLLEELKTGRFQAVLDVYHKEPLPKDDPLRSLSNVLLFPHMAGPTFDMREKVVLRLIDDIHALSEGHSCPDIVSRERAARMTGKE